MNKREIRKFLKDNEVDGCYISKTNHRQVFLNFFDGFDPFKLVKVRIAAMMGNRNIVCTSDTDKGQIHLLARGGSIFTGRSETEYNGTAMIDTPTAMWRTLANWK